MEFETYGFDLREVAKEVANNGNTELAEVIENAIANLQTIYEVLDEHHTSTGGEPAYKIDAEYVKSLLK